MQTPHWQLQTPIEAFIFDCDGTLSTLEGIDELAAENHVGPAVTALTADAMGKTGMKPALYQKRLDLVRPSQEQVLRLGKKYFDHRVPDLSPTLALLKHLNKPIYIISAGLYPAVALFGELLQIPAANIFAVNIEFDSQGHYKDFDHSSPLVTTDGKRQLVSQLKEQHPRILYVGDGLNDYATYDLCTRFIGFGGAYYRENIASRCQFYLKTLAMAPLLPLALTAAEYTELSAEEKALYERGRQALATAQVLTGR